MFPEESFVTPWIVKLEISCLFQNADLRNLTDLHLIPLNITQNCGEALCVYEK